MAKRSPRTSYQCELLWKQYFRDPSQWWDNRSIKIFRSYPDFKHKITKDLLWIDSTSNPFWVREALSRRAETGDKVIHDEVHAFVSLLRACAKKKDLQRGTRVHDDILRKCLLEKCSDALATMYAQCGALEKAQELLDLHKSRDVVSWTALITGYARKGQGQAALDCFEHIQCEGLSLHAMTYTSILKACGSIKAAEKGKLIHDEITRLGLLEDNVVLGNALVDMYAKCGDLEKAQRVLEELPARDVVSWNTLMGGYTQEGQGKQALTCYEKMQHDGLSPNVVTFVSVLKACSSIGAIDKGGKIHDEIAKQQLVGDNIVLGTALIDMYAKCGALEKAQEVLKGLPIRDVVAWSALIEGYAEQAKGEQALSCFEIMQDEGVSPNAITYLSILKACGSIGAADKGEQICDVIDRQGILGKDIVLGNAMVVMYAKCGALVKARKVLEKLLVRDVATWNALIGGYEQQGEGKEALDCLDSMRREGIMPDALTFLSILKVSGTLRALEKGELVHKLIAGQGLLENDHALGNALVSMYAKCGALAKAEQVVAKLHVRDVIAWNALISGYAQEGQGEQALDCFERMRHHGITADAVTFLGSLKACGSIGAVDKGEFIHEEIARLGLLRNNVPLGNALVGMYAKCGVLQKALRVLDELPDRDIVSWNALIAGFALEGDDEQALNCMEQMQCEGLSPNAVTFLCLLNACNHSGIIDDAQSLFIAMSSKYGMKPDSEHHNCMVDLLGRLGHLDKAVGMMEKRPSLDCLASDSWTVLSALLGASRKWGEVNVGRWAFEHAVT